MNENLLSVRNLSKSFDNGVKALDNISFDLERGEILGIVGESGCGKSTLLRIISHLISPSSGSVLFNGKEMTNCKGKELFAMRRNIQIVFQDSSAALDTKMRIGDAIAEPLVIYSRRSLLDKKLSKSEIKQRTLSLMNDVSLSESLYDRYPSELSGGEKQRVGIARAMALSPSLILLDEPVSALDVSVEAQILSLIDSIRRERGTSFIMVSHDLSAIRSISDRILVMYLGRIVEEGTNEDVSLRPIHPYTEALLSALPSSGKELLLKQEESENISKGCPFFPRCGKREKECSCIFPPLVTEERGHKAYCFHQRESFS